MTKFNSSLGKGRILEILSKDGVRVHFVGVGGVSMYSLFNLSSHFQIHPSGNDRADGEYVRRLTKRGGEVCIGAARKLSGVDLVVYSLAVDERDQTLLEAERLGIPTASRAEYMNALAACYGKRIGVAGTHGKSTVTAMLSHILSSVGKEPTTLSGAKLFNSTEPFRIGALDYFLCEACEYKDSLLALELDLCLFLNLEYDHPDYFKNEDMLRTSFFSAMKKCSRAIVAADDENLAKIAEKLDTPPIKVGKSREFDYSYTPSPASHGIGFSFFSSGNFLGDVTLSVMGDFNATNAAVAIAAAMELGVPFSACKAALSEFSGIERRLELVGHIGTRPIYYDYAHHPTEIREGLKAIKSHTGGPITLIFGAHTHSRTAALWSELVGAISLADRLVVFSVDAIREEKIPGICAATLAAAAGGTPFTSYKSLAHTVLSNSGPVVIMGAADMSEVKKFILSLDNHT